MLSDVQARRIIRDIKLNCRPSRKLNLSLSTLCTYRQFSETGKTDVETDIPSSLSDHHMLKTDIPPSLRRNGGPNQWISANSSRTIFTEPGRRGNTSVLGGRIFISRGQKLIHMQKNAAEHAGERGNAFQIWKRCT